MDIVIELNSLFLECPIFSFEVIFMRLVLLLVIIMKYLVGRSYGLQVDACIYWMENNRRCEFSR